MNGYELMFKGVMVVVKEKCCFCICKKKKYIKRLFVIGL